MVAEIIPQGGRGPKRWCVSGGAGDDWQGARTGLWHSHTNIVAREDWWVISQLHIIGGRQAIDMSGTAGRLWAMTLNAQGTAGPGRLREASQASA